MSYELFYTSVPQGLHPGSKGFCTVAQTRGIPSLLAERLDGLGAYRLLYPVGSPDADRNPVSWAHCLLTVRGVTYSVLSRVCFTGVDYSQRSNVLAHHVALTPAERPAGGPAWLLAQPGFMATSWMGDQVEYESGPRVPTGRTPTPAPCHAWQAAAGDAGWAGALVQRFIDGPDAPCYVIVDADCDALRLMAEAVSLLPEPRRWQVTFNTYFSELPAGVTCAWRVCVDGTAAAEQARASGEFVIDLTAGDLGPAPQGVYADFARTGVPPAPVASPPVSSRAPGSLGAPVPRASINPPATLPEPTVAEPVAVAEVEPEPDVLPPRTAYAIPIDRPPAQVFVRGPRWGLIAAGVAVWTVAVAGIAVAMVRADVGAKAAAREAEAKAETERLVTQARAEGMSHPDPTLFTTKPQADAAIDELRAKVKQLEAQVASLSEAKAAPPPSPTPPPQVTEQPKPDAPTPDRTPAPVVPAVAVKPATPEAALRGHAIAAAGAHAFWIDPADMARLAGNGPVPVAEVTSLESDAVLSLRPFKARPEITADGGPGSLKVVRRSAGTGDLVPLCEFHVDGGRLTVTWPKIDPAKESAKARAEYFANAVLVAGATRVQFGQPQALLVGLRDLRAAGAGGGNGPTVVDEAKTLRITLAPSIPWQVAPESSTTDVRLTHSANFTVGIALDAGKRLCSTFSDQYDRRVKERQSADAALLDAEAQLALQDTPAHHKARDAKKKDADEKRQAVEAMEKLAGTIAVEAANGAVLHEITFSGAAAGAAGGASK